MDGRAQRSSVSKNLRIATPPLVAFEAVTSGARTTLRMPSDQGGVPNSVVRVLLGSGRNSIVRSDEAPPAVLVPLRGRVRMIDGANDRLMQRGQLFVVEGGQRLHLMGGAGSLWIVVLASPPAWRRLLCETSESLIAEPVLLPALHVAGRAMCRAAIGLAREAARGCAESTHAAALVFTALLADLQRSALDPLIDRCPGRMLVQRRGTFLRLQRAYNLLKSAGNIDLDVGAVARIANFSPCYFTRTFNEVYGETPHAVIVERRFRRALHLVQATELSISEVASAAGFEDRCAFARSFKRRFGRTAKALRDRSTA